MISQGRIFLTSLDQGSQVKRARIVKALATHEAERLKDPALVKFKVKFYGDCLSIVLIALIAILYAYTQGYF